ncbi:ATP-dependent Clp protease ATP-binding subunit ClpC [Amycolatopsis marina]|uniref:ATP-dependent Clp protease ATP-binding subunit ClpC n=2 Tax=Amycolatopsis marina TaxID=490629 RepID=A0A1I1BX22_9PSEU|nr:Clp protease N-terminal domain-containing protein [Amycolatopsis marina]SFB54954.1 ATP-dependent Clp protease ATP-binding subunit ClpC [Amycolatopsis marina]
MLEILTDQARRAFVLAEEYASSLNHPYIGTEHVLVGLLDEGGTAACALESLGAGESTIRSGIEEIIGRGEPRTTSAAPWTKRTERVVRLAKAAAADEGREFVGTPHLLLGLLSDDDDAGVAVRVLGSLGVTKDAVQAALAA